MQQRALRCLTALLYTAAALGALWLFVHCLLPCGAPFLLAFALASLLEPAVRAMTRLGWRRGPAAGVLTLGLLGLLGWGAVKLAGWAVNAAAELTRGMPELMNALGEGLAEQERRLMRAMAAAPEGLAAYLDSALERLGEMLYSLPVQASQWALNAMARAAQSGPSALLFLATAGLSTYFFSAAYPRILAFLRIQLPEQAQRRMEELGRDLKDGFGGLLRAQAILMGMSFAELLLAFLLLGVERAPAMAVLTALVDALPVFGTGTVLVPWALYSLLLGDGRRAAGLLVCWLLVSFLRSCLQAKLLGDQIGLAPLASLLAVYIGWTLCGVGGMLLFPVLLATLQQLNDRGVLRLWKSL